jgi:hypothetical protein
MLQIIIVHEKNNVKVLEIKDIETLTVLSQFDENTKMIDLEPLKPYVGEKIMVSHFNKVNDCIMFDYEHIKTLTDVGQDSDDIWYFQYN